MSAASHAIDAPSPWVTRWAGEVRAGGTVLDVACGHGRHALFFAVRGHVVHAVDRDAAAIEPLTAQGIVTQCTDIEMGSWPYGGHTFDAVVVTNYLHRPLNPALLDALAPGGVLIYETFALGNEKYGRPSNPNFLLAPGELLDAVRGCCRVIAFEDLYVQAPRPAMVQRICARRPLA